MRFLTLGKPNVYPLADWSFLEAWPPEKAGMGRPAPRERWIVVTAHHRLLEPLSKLVPSGRIIHEFKAPGGNTWAVVYAVPESALPPTEDLAAIRQQWRVEMRL